MKPLIRESWHFSQPKDTVKYGRVVYGQIEIALRDAFAKYADVRASKGESSATVRVISIERVGGPSFSGRVILTVKDEKVIDGNLFISYEPAIRDKDRRMVEGLLNKLNFVKNKG
jgi:hypothetical protein